MSKKFTTPVRYNEEENHQAESRMVNELLRAGRGRSVTVGMGSANKTSKEMGAWLRAESGRGEAGSPAQAAALAKEGEFKKVNLQLAVALAKLTDQQLAEVKSTPALLPYLVHERKRRGGRK